MKVKVENMTSSNGNNVPNQFILHNEDATYFQSYNSIICKIEDHKVFLDERFHDYSRTTSKYLTKFLGKDSKERKARITSGEYILTNLN